MQGTVNPARPIADNGVPQNRKVNADDDDTDDEYNDDDDAVVLFSRPKNSFKILQKMGSIFVLHSGTKTGGRRRKTEPYVFLRRPPV